MLPKAIRQKLKKLLPGIALGGAALIAGSTAGCDEQAAAVAASFSEQSIKSVAGGGEFNRSWLVPKRTTKKAAK